MQTSTSAAPSRQEHGKFVYRKRVHFDDLDSFQMLHNTRYALFVEHATEALYVSGGQTLQADPDDNPDQIQVVRAFRIEMLAPFRGIGELTLQLSVQRLGETSCAYAFECRDARAVLCARGERVIVKLDASTGRPTAWTPWFVALHQPLLQSEAAPA